MAKTLILLLTVTFLCKSDSATVQTKSGPVNGLEITVNSQKLHEFRGIPYAEPPIGERRFRKPIPKTTWIEPFDATAWPNSCVQPTDGPIDFHLLSKNISEDCLYLNIWSPADLSGVSNELLKPVFFWIHGGSLTHGAASQEWYVADHLAAIGNIVVVTINYRLGPFGFFYAGTEAAPGNVGIRDQLLALNWVRDNIAAFGGDPDHVTIAGESAGAWSVGLHLVSPLSRGLFKQAVLMSGAPTLDFLNKSPSEAQKHSLNFAKQLGCGDGTQNGPEVLECLRSVEAQKVLEVYNRPENSNDALMKTFPLVTFGDELLPKAPVEMLASGDHKKDVNVLFGTVSDEGGLFVGFFYSQLLNPASRFSKSEIKTMVVEMCNKFYGSDETYCDEIGNYYVDPVSEENQGLLKKQVGMVFGDFLIACPTTIWAERMLRNDPRNTKIYQYLFSYKPDRSDTGFYSLTLPCADWMGACHANELWSLFGLAYKTDTFSALSHEITDKFLNTFVHFVRNGSPPEMRGGLWSPYKVLDSNVISNFYEFNAERQEGNFGKLAKRFECQTLWKKFYGIEEVRSEVNKQKVKSEL